MLLAVKASVAIGMITTAGGSDASFPHVLWDDATGSPLPKTFSTPLSLHFKQTLPFCCLWSQFKNMFGQMVISGCELYTETMNCLQLPPFQHRCSRIANNYNFGQIHEQSSNQLEMGGWMASTCINATHPLQSTLTKQSPKKQRIHSRSRAFNATTCWDIWEQERFEDY